MVHPDRWYPQPVKNGVLIIDEYGHWPGSGQAPDDYFNRGQIKPLPYRVGYNCGFILIKGREHLKDAAVTNFLVVVGMLVIAVTVLPLSRKEDWWIRIFDFPRLQITVVAALTLIIYLILADDYTFGDYAFVAALSASVLYQGYMMFPYTRFARQQVQRSRGPEPESSFSIVFANVLMDNRNAARLREIIREADPDLILAVETDDWWTEQLREFEKTHTFTVLQPQANTYGRV